MRQSKQVKPRKCKHCKEVFAATALEIKQHAEECQKKSRDA
jgi:hypothetical protein